MGFSLSIAARNALAPERLRRLATPRPGQDANTPSRIPARGWRQVASRTWKAFNTHQIPAVAAGATFYGLLALFPALGAFVSLYGLVANVDDARRQIQGLSGLLPGGALTVIGDQMTLLTTVNHAHLGIAFATGLLVSIWSANAGVKALMSGLNVAYEEQEKRRFVALNLVSLGFTLGFTVFSVIGVAALAAAPRVLEAVGLTSYRGASVLRWPLVLVVTMGLVALLYRFGPSRDQARWRWITPGSLLAAAGWMVMSGLFTLYVANFGHYNKTYGPLGALIGFMTWIWFSTIILLLGAELNSQLEQQTTVDTTIGPPRPMGQRGAVVADGG